MSVNYSLNLHHSGSDFQAVFTALCYPFLSSLTTALSHISHSSLSFSLGLSALSCGSFYQLSLSGLFSSSVFSFLSWLSHSLDILFFEHTLSNCFFLLLIDVRPRAPLLFLKPERMSHKISNIEKQFVAVQLDSIKSRNLTLTTLFKKTLNTYRTRPNTTLSKSPV